MQPKSRNSAKPVLARRPGHLGGAAEPLPGENAAADSGRAVYTQTPLAEAGYTLLELLLVLALVGILVSLFAPSLQSVLATYHIERAGDAFRARLLKPRLRAIENGVPYAIAYQPGEDRFAVWAIEPVVAQVDLTGTGTGLTLWSGAAAAGLDAYDRHYYSLNTSDSNKEFQFMSMDPLEELALVTPQDVSLTGTTAKATGEELSNSRYLAATRATLLGGSERSFAALQVPGLQPEDMATPVVFEPDGTADRDALFRIADRRGQYVEVRLHALTGAVTVSKAKKRSELAGSRAAPVGRRAEEQEPGMLRPSRSREIRPNQAR